MWYNENSKGEFEYEIFWISENYKIAKSIIVCITQIQKRKTLNIADYWRRMDLRLTVDAIGSTAPYFYQHNFLPWWTDYILNVWTIWTSQIDVIRWHILLIWKVKTIYIYELRCYIVSIVMLKYFNKQKWK